MDPSAEFKAEQQAIQAALVRVNRTVNSITAEDLSFLRTVTPDVAALLDVQTERLLRLANGLLASAATTSGRRAPLELEDAEDVELNWKGVVDVIDSLLERADTTLDEYTGMLKRKDAPTTEGGPESKKAKQQQQQQHQQSGTPERLDWSLRRANIAKPQELFEHKPDNFAEGPWKPLLTTKPHAVVPLAESLTTFDYDGRLQYRHPYEAEIRQMQYPDTVRQMREPIPFTPPEASAAVWVDTYEGVLAMLEELRAADEIAVDLEHHDFRTYSGLLSLMQISTRAKDWIVDTLQPWRHRLEVLNEVFADPTKLKVFHGSSSDIVWLQRDLGLYVVGLFDTYFASERLAYAKRSLAFLLERFVQFDADKKYQMADWRIRPLGEEMLYYARSDTHYLLYIYDMVRNELLAQRDDTAVAAGAAGAVDTADTASTADPTDSADALKHVDSLTYVLEKSREVSLSRHEALFFDPTTGQGPRGWLNSLLRSFSMMNGEQFAVYKAVFAWRDNLARKLDESPGYLMPMRILNDIARILPPDHKALWSLLAPTPRATKSAMEELFVLIQTARKEGATGPTSVEYLRSDFVSSMTGSMKTDGVGRSRGSNRTTGAALGTGHAATGVIHSKDVTDLPDVGELRSHFSQLWGPAQICMNRTSADEAAVGARVAAPWFVQAAIAAAAVTVATTTQEPAKSAAAAPSIPANEDFIALQPIAAESRQPKTAEVKEKRSDDDMKDKDEVEEDEEEGTFTLKWGKAGKHATDTSKVAVKEKKKEERKQRDKKKEKRENQAKDKAADDNDVASTQASNSGGGVALADNDADTGDSGFVPFDYDAAGSVLHHVSEERPNHGKKAFNPYGAKGDEGPKGARRMHYEKTGKSATFKK